jgi:hypothetical protein
MTHPSADDEPLDPAAARMVARVRALMLIAALTTGLAIAAVLGVIAYRLLTLQGSAQPSSASAPASAAADVTAVLPKDARIIATSATADRIVLTIESGGRTEVRTFDARTLQPAGRLRFRSEP